MRLTLACAVGLAACGTREPPLASPLPAGVEPLVRIAHHRQQGSTLGITLVLANPTSSRVRFVGYDPDSFDPPLAEGQIAPTYQLEERRAEGYRAVDIGFCGVGMEERELAPFSTAWFRVLVQDVDEPVRVGVRYTAEQRQATAWSPPLSGS